VSSEIHRADWSIPYPSGLDEKQVPLVLRSLTHVEHDWRAFPWHLARRLVGLLEKPESSFDYLHVTAFFRARAAMLALKGDVLDPKELHAALSRHQVQAGGIYRKHLMQALRAFLKEHNFAQLPDCEWEPLAPWRSVEQAERNRDRLLRVVGSSESDYLSTLILISLASGLDERVREHRMVYWAKGAKMPRWVAVQARTRRHDIGYDLLPETDEIKRMIRAGRTVKKIVVQLQAEFESPPAAAEKTVEKTLAPVVEIFKKASLVATPPHKRQWWENAKAAYERQPGPLEADKWHAVSKLVIAAAIEENRKPVRERHSDYATPLMLRKLLARLNAPGASRAQIERDYAGYLRRRVAENERIAGLT